MNGIHSRVLQVIKTGQLMKHFKAKSNDCLSQKKFNKNIYIFWIEVTLGLDEVAIYHADAHESSHIAKSIIDSPYSLVFPSEPHNDH